MEAGQSRIVYGTEITAIRRTDFGIGYNRDGHLVLEFRGAFTIDNPELPGITKHLHLEMGAIDLDSGEADIVGSRGFGLVTAHVQGNFKSNTGSVRGMRTCSHGLSHASLSEASCADEARP